MKRTRAPCQAQSISQSPLFPLPFDRYNYESSLPLRNICFVRPKIYSIHASERPRRTSNVIRHWSLLHELVTRNPYATGAYGISVLVYVHIFISLHEDRLVIVYHAEVDDERYSVEKKKATTP